MKPGWTPEVVQWNLGDVIAKLRSVNGWTAARLATVTGLRPNTISDIESGKNARYESLDVIAQAFHTTVETIRSLIPSPTTAQSGFTISDKNYAKGAKAETSVSVAQDFTAESAARNMLTRGHANTPAPLRPATTPEERLADAFASLQRCLDEVGRLGTIIRPALEEAAADRLLAIDRAARTTRETSTRGGPKPRKSHRKTSGAA